MNFTSNILVILAFYVSVCSAICREAGSVCSCEKVVSTHSKNFTIDKTVHHSCSVVYFTNSNLEVIPQEVYSFSQNVITVFFKSCNITGIYEEDYKQIAALQNLNLDYNKIEFVPSNVFQHSSNLSFLSISYNKISKIDALSFYHTRKLRELALNSNIIKDLPGSVFEPLEFLEILDLGKNEIVFLADDVFLRNKNLRILNLQDNKLKIVEKNIVTYPRGLALILDDFQRDTKLTSTRFLIGLSELTKLTLTDNYFAYIENQTFQFNQKLQELIILRGNLSFVEAGAFVHNRNLSLLDLSYNELETVNVDHLTHIRIINLRANRLTNIDYKTLFLGGDTTNVYLSRNFWNCSFVDGFLRFTQANNISLVNYTHTLDTRFIFQEDCKTLEANPPTVPVELSTRSKDTQKDQVENISIKGEIIEIKSTTIIKSKSVKVCDHNTTDSTVLMYSGIVLSFLAVLAVAGIVILINALDKLDSP